MATNQYANKFVYHGETKFDLSADTIEASKVLAGYTGHDKSGAPFTGTCAFDSDTSDDTAAVAEILSGKTAHARGVQLEGTMPNRGAITGTITTKTQEFTIQQGYHDGSGKVAISETEQAKIIPTNIREGIEILGVTGSMSGEEGVKAQSKLVIPTNASQTITPDTGYNYLSQVVVNPIPYKEIDNAAGGYTITIG